MQNTGYWLTDWLFFFNKKHQAELTKIMDHKDNNTLKDEFVTWKLITVFLPLITFLFVLLLNICTAESASASFYSFINNGSLPIIAFGILTSGMPFLLEQLEGFPELYSVRRRVMAISLFFLFLSATIYIIQTLAILTPKLSYANNFLLMVIAIYIFFVSSSTGYKMFILQSKNIKPYDEDIKDGVSDLRNAVSDLD